MGNGPKRRSRTHGSTTKNQAKGQKTKRYRRDLDQIQLDIELGAREARARRNVTEATTLDREDLPGLGEHLCLPCDRHFDSANSLASHLKTKLHRKQLKLLAEPAFTQAEAELGVGRGVDNRQRTPREPVNAPGPSGMAVDA